MAHPSHTQNGLHNERSLILVVPGLVFEILCELLMGSILLILLSRRLSVDLMEKRGHATSKEKIFHLV